MRVMLQRHISHATGWSGMWMTAYWEINLYSGCCDAHARVCKKKEKEGRSKLSGSFNSDPTALIDTQWINNALTSYLTAPSSYVYTLLHWWICYHVRRKTHFSTFLTKLIIAVQIKQHRENGWNLNAAARTRSKAKLLANTVHDK